MSRLVLFFFVFFVSFVVDPAFADPLSPQEELKTFKTLPGFKVELVACEPNVIDPVAMAFDERGRLFVCEMIGYPNGGVATGVEKRGRIRCLTDEDGDGVYEKSVVYADGLRFPTGIRPWKGGVIVCNAPDIIYLPDDDHDNKADKIQVLYTGFGLDNIQQIVNSPRWGIDNWVYCTVGNAGGSITCPSHPEMKPLNLRGRGIRFRPDDLTTLEPTSGGGQYGLTCDEAGHWFVNTNSQHLRQIVLPDEYLRRNPFLAVPAVTVDIPEHGAACKVFRISPFEEWRVERTTRRKGGPDAKRFPSTELVPGGYITSACSPCYYGLNEPLFPERDRGCVYVCDPANNLITRDKLEPNGSIYKGKRIDDGVEFLASTDTWFRPVHLTVGPEGALYILDFYREVIETPLSLPDDIKKRLNLESRQRGRIWRIVPEGFKAKALPKLDRPNVSSLIIHLTGKPQWARETAQRLLYEERPVKPTMRQMERLLDALVDRPAAGAALATLQACGKLSPALVMHALRNEDEAGRVAALRMSEQFMKDDPELENAVLKLEDDRSPFVRFQLALSAGNLNPNLAGPLLGRLLRRPGADRWLVTACLSSAKDAPFSLLKPLAEDSAFTAAHPDTLRQLAGMVGARAVDAEILVTLTLLSKAKTPAAQLAILDGLGEGMRSRDNSLGRWLAEPPAAAKSVVADVLPVFRQAADQALDVKAKAAARLTAIRLIGYGPFDIAAGPLAELLSPRNAVEIQSAALRALAGFDNPKVGSLILEQWDGFGPTLRREALETLLARKDRVTALLDAVEKRKVLASQIEAARAESLRKHPDATIRNRSTKLLAGQVAADRKKVLDDYRPALDLKTDAARGRDLFRKNCTACHRLENVGYEVGANLVAALRNKSKEALLIDILDPSREVDPRYVNYQVTTTTGRTVSGLLAVETPTSVTLRRGEKAEDTILRAQIEELRATTKSLMPEEFEKQLDKQQMADLIEYLMTVVK
ncbi:MAG: c-type cytochrome [Zavarzinella sp.]|nr:c-type cytochrome [Zavarzinella sp.]